MNLDIIIYIYVSLNDWTGLHQPICAELRTLPHAYGGALGFDVRWVKVAGGCEL